MQCTSKMAHCNISAKHYKLETPEQCIPLPRHVLLVSRYRSGPPPKFKIVPCRTDGRLLLSGFQAIVTLTLTLDQVIRHTVVHHSSTSIYIPNSIEIGKTFVNGLNAGTIQSSRSRDTKKYGRPNFKNSVRPNLDTVL